ncbi:MAG: RNA pyrophosphohydrolase [Alphaproteobacteria bacterium]
MPDRRALPYRPCVGLMLLNRRGEAFIGNRITSDHFVAWQMPQGGIDPGETPEEAAMRELHEEVGTDKAEILAAHPDWLNYELPDPVLGRALNGKYRGQTQKWFALRFTGTDEDIDIRTAHPEFNRWRWCPLDGVLEHIVSFKRPVYERVIEEFRPLAERVARGG